MIAALTWTAVVVLTAAGALLLMISGSNLFDWGVRRESGDTIEAQRQLDGACISATLGALLVIVAIVVRP